MVRFQDCYIFADLPRTMMFALVAILGRPPGRGEKKIYIELSWSR